MMIMIMGLMMSLSWSAAPPMHWSALTEIQERHEFYQNNEVINRPKGVQQTLFAVVFPDRNLLMQKDCVYYRVPEADDGIFKVKKVDVSESCEKYMDAKGDLEIGPLKALQFSIDTDALSFHFTFDDFRITRWRIPLVNQLRAETPLLFTSSAKFRVPGLLLLAPVERPEAELPKKKRLNLKNGICHAIGDDCEELSPSNCQQCAEGWYEIPNGCLQGPKYCGKQVCGLKNRPACRRGMRYQRVRKKFECRTDSSFAYCAPGLSVQCEGSKAFCR